MILIIAIALVPLVSFIFHSSLKTAPLKTETSKKKNDTGIKQS